MPLTNRGPIVVGGLGGSGTRLIAAMLKESGIYIGSYLNESLDNLWFTFLFRRPLQYPFSDIDTLFEIFERRMQGNTNWTLGVKRKLVGCCLDFISHNYVPANRWGFPAKTLQSFFTKLPLDQGPQSWGWKEPNSHLFVRQILDRYANLRYIHLIRHPLDAVYGKNYNQYKNWRKIFGDEESDEHLGMLKFYDRVHSKVIGLNDARVMLFKYEDIITNQHTSVRQLFQFIGMSPEDDLVKRCVQLISKERALPRYLNINTRNLEPMATAVAGKYGYTIR